MTTQTELSKLGPLYVVGKEIDVTPESFGFLRGSMDIVHDPEALRERIKEDGYLYLPGMLDAGLALAARREVVNRLDKRGFLDPNHPKMEVVPAGGDNAFVWLREEYLAGNKPLDELLYGGEMMRFYRQFLEGDILHYTFTWFRAMPPGTSSPPHCDIVFMGRGTFNLFTSWTPLGDVSIKDGPLVVLEGSNTKTEQLREYMSMDVDTYCDGNPNADKILSGEMKGDKDGVLSRDARAVQRWLGGRWLTTNFKMGDVIIFTMGTVHASLDNKSKGIRLSTDSRYQLQSEPTDERWIGKDPIGHGHKAMRATIC